MDQFQVDWDLLQASKSKALSEDYEMRKLERASTSRSSSVIEAELWQFLAHSISSLCHSCYTSGVRIPRMPVLEHGCAAWGGRTHEALWSTMISPHSNQHIQCISMRSSTITKCCLPFVFSFSDWLKSKSEPPPWAAQSNHWRVQLSWCSKWLRLRLHCYKPCTL